MNDGYQIDFRADPAEFLAVAGDLLAADPVVASVIATVAERAVRERAAGVPVPAHPCWWAAVIDDGAVVGAAMRTAPFTPHPMFLLPMPDRAAVALARAMQARGEHPGGCNGALPAARVCAEEAARLWGGTAEVRQRTRLFECSEVRRPGEVDGTLRTAMPGDADLVFEWFLAFGLEADEQAGRPPGSSHDFVPDRDDIDRRIAGGRIWLLQDPDGTVVHMTAVNPPAYGVSRVGPVYTPKPARGRGYASYVVAELTARGLAEGVRMCLFTDQANPISNKVYEAIGYERVADMANVRVEPA